MDQHQTKISFPLRFKLLIGVVGLFVFVIGFLSISTTILLKDDKRAYTYLIQETEAQLAAKEFLNISNIGIEALRQSLGTIDPQKSATPQQVSLLNSILANQSALTGLQIERWDPKTQIRTVLAQVGKADADHRLSDDWLKAVGPALLKDGFSFVNLSKTGSAATLGVILADIKLKSNPNGMPIAVGTISLQDFAKEIKGSSLTIADAAGWVLYDTDAGIQFGNKNLGNDPFFRHAAANSVSTGAQEFERDGVAILGSYVRPGLGLTVMSQTEWRRAMGAFYGLIEKFFLFGGMAVGIAIIATIVFAKRLTAPLTRLYSATQAVADGNFNIDVPSTSRDEIGALSSSFTVMSHKINDLIKDSMEKVRLDGELAIASTVQEKLFPPTSFENQQIMIRSHYKSATECGGDWWGFLTGENKFALFIADATGHGLPSALITAAARSCFSVIQKIAQEDPNYALSPQKMLSYANRAVYDAASGTINMTFFAGVLDFNKGLLTFSSAGHNPPWLFKKTAGGYDLKSLVAKGKRLGETPDYNDFEEKVMPFSKDDILFMYTDGITEGKNPEGVMYGKKQLRKIVEAQLATGPQAVIEKLMEDFMKHNTDKPLDDDITLTVAQIL